MEPGGRGSVSGASGSSISYSINRSTDTRSFPNSADRCIPYEKSSPIVKTEEIANPADDVSGKPIRKCLTIIKCSPEHFMSCMSVCPSVLTITYERVGVEWWNLRSRVTSSSKIGHVHDVWFGQTGVYIMHMYLHKVHIRLHTLHVHLTHSCGIHILYMYICMCYSSLFLFTLSLHSISIMYFL